MRRTMAGGGRLAEMSGWVEAVRPGRVTGFALDGPGRVALEVRVDGVAVGWGMADRSRPDLAMAGVGDGFSAFDITFEMPGEGGAVEVRRVEDGVVLAGSPVLLARDGGGSLVEAIPLVADAAAGRDVAASVLRGIDGAVLAAGLRGPFGTGLRG